MAPQLHRRLPQELVEEILEAFNEGRVTEEQAQALLGIKRTRLYLLRREWLFKSYKGEFTLSKHRGRPGPRFDPEIEHWLHQELGFIKEEANHGFRNRFNFAHLAERAEQRFHRSFPRHSLRRWAIRQGYYQGDPEQSRKVFTRFETSAPGVLFQHGSSRHIWLPYTREYSTLIATQDNHSRKVVGGLLVASETAWEHLVVARETLETYGRPLAYYVDQHSIFRFVEHQGVHVSYRLRQDQGRVQFRRALEELGVGIIYAHSPQAKGKIEKRFDYFQRRLPYLCERYKVTDIQEANRILREEVIPYYNERHIHAETEEIPNVRWQRAIRENRAKLRPLPEGVDLEIVFSLQYQRSVGKDGTISFDAKRWKSGAQPEQKVIACLHPGSKLIIVQDGMKLWEYQL